MYLVLFTVGNVATIANVDFTHLVIAVKGCLKKQLGLSNLDSLDELLHLRKCPTIYPYITKFSPLFL